ncbi:NAD(P)-dependent oxidoreductase [Microbulbifer hainanensis]|uniref:NAD(P)-dependent oxidoreductase n=1 Tax=Microbulbifer hainanensis TaxID=2735675 RepID=UPI0018690DCE|nr:DUF1932 domain-containing protein [Microbulbifer hainanensis]
MKQIRTVGQTGFGEVGAILATDFAAFSSRTRLVAFDRLCRDPHSFPSRALAERPWVRSASSAPAMAVGCELIISAVTAGQALQAAEAVLPGLSPGAYYLDLNSVSPSTKRTIAKRVEDAGGRFVEGSIMSPIEPRRIAAPILVGGPHAEEFLPLGQALGFSGMAFCSVELGRASATKMCRSVMIKGMEALLAESLLAARQFGVEREVLASLDNIFPLPDWPEQARYMISRSLEHGRRRAEEMAEAARTVREAGLTPHMSEGCAERQAWAAQFAQVPECEGLESMLDAIIEGSQQVSLAKDKLPVKQPG